jgi:hypothetical protein
MRPSIDVPIRVPETTPARPPTMAPTPAMSSTIGTPNHAPMIPARVPVTLRPMVARIQARAPGPRAERPGTGAGSASDESSASFGAARGHQVRGGVPYVNPGSCHYCGRGKTDCRPVAR